MKPREHGLTFTRRISDLPLADALHSDSKWSLQTGAELKGIAADLNDVVDESTHGRQREGRGEEHHVAKLDEHLLVVLEGVLRGARWSIKNHSSNKKLQAECYYGGLKTKLHFLRTKCDVFHYHTVTYDLSKHVHITFVGHVCGVM